MTDVYLNGRYVGEIKDPKEFVQKLIDERRKTAELSNLNVNYDEELDMVSIDNLKGRIRKPLLVVKDGKTLLTDKHISQLEKGDLSFSDLVKQGIIEYLDASEEENAVIAFSEKDLTDKNTHLAIHSSDMFGLAGSLLPYANFSHGVRISQGAKNQKQAVGIYATNFHGRMDMDVNLLHSPQVPIVQTKMHQVSDFDKHPSGQNVVIAIMSYKGYNMEDAIIVNKGSIERGLGRSTYYRPYLAEEMRYSGGLTDEIGVPDKDVRGYRSERDYQHLDADGLVKIESKVREDDVVIGKTSPPRFLSSMDEYNLVQNFRRESSLSLRHGEKGVVDFILVSESAEGNKMTQVRLRDQRIPEIGDKFTSRHGQKGVIGMILPHCDMPFSASGIVPDLIFSPHGIPSRMTISHMIELISGKAGALNGQIMDGTTFGDVTDQDIRKQLHEVGFREDGTETFYNGETGEQIEAKIYVGSMYYLRLKHMVENKIHSRARGPIQLLTRQPTEGRAKEGGLRLGEMEKDTFVAHGASLLLKERFDADETLVPVCQECGMIAVYNEFKDKAYCPMCGDNVEINRVEISYAFKLLLDELKSMCVYPKIKLKNKYD